MPIVDAETFAHASLDYLVIGGGTAGLVVAARCVFSPRTACWSCIVCRLSEDPDVVVGVLEAGAYMPDRPDINVPGGCRVRDEGRLSDESLDRVQLGTIKEYQTL